MALWQFRFSLVPEAGIILKHGKVPSVLESFLPADPDDLDTTADASPQLAYWGDINPSTISSVHSLLPPMDSWLEDARMFGYRHGHQIEAWSHDLICKFDARDPDTAILDQYVSLARELDCRIVLHETGQVLKADVAVIHLALRESRAARFLRNPHSTLKEFHKKRRPPTS